MLQPHVHLFYYFYFLFLCFYDFRYLDCVELNKFEPFESEFRVENRSVELINGSKYWAAIVFNDSIANMNKLPTHVSYKIRMNTDKVYTGSNF